MSKKDLQDAVAQAQIALADAEDALEAYEDSIENNTFSGTSLEEAAYKVELRLEAKAGQACEGSYCCGLEKYTQEFVVDGVKYLGTLTCEYNRHDKTYYYVEESDFTYTEIYETE